MEIVAYSVPQCWEKKEDWVCDIAAWSALEGGLLQSRGGNIGESDSGSGLSFVLALCGRGRHLFELRDSKWHGAG